MALPPTESVNQRVFGAVLVLLVTIGLILLYQDLQRRTPGKSRIEWPPASSAKP